MWIARDEDGTLVVYNKKPSKFKHEWRIPGELFFYVYDDVANEFSEVKWEDEEPRELILLLQ